MADIFLSYAREDEARARRLAEAFASHGWSVWWDRRIPHGQDFTAHIQQQLDDARCIVVLWTKDAVKSQFVRDEASEGLNGRLVPLLLDVVKQPLGFRQLQAADLSNWTPETPHDEFSRVVDSIAAIVAAHPLAAPATPTPAGTAMRTAEPEPAPPPGRPLSYTCDVYVSYTHLDDQPLVEGQQGWVTTFCRALETRVAQLIGRQPNIWVNAKLVASDIFGDGDTNALQTTATFVAIVSPRYVKSEWGRLELAEFEKACARQGGLVINQKSRLLKVVKTPVDPETMPPILRETLGYEFFQIDPETGQVCELDESFGPEAQREFRARLDDLARDIAALVEERSR